MVVVRLPVCGFEVNLDISAQLLTGQLDYSILKIRPAAGIKLALIDYSQIFSTDASQIRSQMSLIPDVIEESFFHIARLSP